MRKILCVLLIAFACIGCSRKVSDCVAEPATTFTIKSSKTTNNGAPFYVILKFTDFPHFLMDDYQTIADLSATASSDNNAFMPICLIPGKTETRIAVPPPDLSTGVYCLFTDCGEEWKHLVDAKEGGGEVTVVLGEHEIRSVDVR